jgi:hypothetical protein
MFNFSRSKVFVALVIATILFYTSCAHQKKEQSVTWLYGYGQVEKINGRVRKLTDRYFVYTFNSKGDVVRIEENIFKSRVDTTRYNTIYDDSGKKTESIGLYFDSGKEIREIYKYDNSGRMIRCINNANNLSADTDRFLYDKAGNLVEHQQYFEKKPLWIFRFKYFYNKNTVCTGVEQSMTTWRDNFKTVTKDTTRYIVFDSKNNWLKAVNFLGNTINRKITYY